MKIVFLKYVHVIMCGTDDKFSVDTVCSDVHGSVHNDSAIVQLSSAVYCLCVLTEQHRTEGISNTGNRLKHTDNR